MRGLTEHQHHGAPRGLMSLFLPKSDGKRQLLTAVCVRRNGSVGEGGSPRLLGIRGDCEAPNVPAEC